MHRLIFAVALALAACTTPAPIESFRDPAQPIYSSAVLDNARLAGDWRQIADFAEKAGCQTAGVRFDARDDALHIQGQLCVAGLRVGLTGPMLPVGPGRFAVAGLPDPVWILWADTDVRTLVVGTPSGRFGMILARDANLPQDRLAAAREVLDWNGYDLGRLRINS